jgi:hypothetical protein
MSEHRYQDDLEDRDDVVDDAGDPENEKDDDGEPWAKTSSGEADDVAES